MEIVRSLWSGWVVSGPARLRLRGMLRRAASLFWHAGCQDDGRYQYNLPCVDVHTLQFHARSRTGVQYPCPFSVRLRSQEV
jgi:hypothetical protein